MKKILNLFKTKKSETEINNELELARLVESDMAMQILLSYMKEKIGCARLEIPYSNNAYRYRNLYSTGLPTLMGLVDEYCKSKDIK